MKNTPKVAPKPTTQKVAPKKPTVEMVSYSIKMVIPTGAYANIQPEIIVKSKSIEDAHNFIAPHMNKLWKEYFLVNERRPEPPKAPVNTVNIGVSTSSTTASVVVPPPAPMTAEEIAKATGGEVLDENSKVAPSPESSVALIKATQAIESCVSLEALELIQNQVNKSVKLTHEDKESLMPLLEKKSIELTFPEDEKRGQ
jgi:hypothetical protein